MNDECDPETDIGNSPRAEGVVKFIRAFRPDLYFQFARFVNCGGHFC